MSDVTLCIFLLSTIAIMLIAVLIIAISVRKQLSTTKEVTPNEKSCNKCCHAGMCPYKKQTENMITEIIEATFVKTYPLQKETGSSVLGTVAGICKHFDKKDK